MIKLVVVDDYHDIPMIAESFVPRMKYEEIGTTYSGVAFYAMYVGIIYEGDKPSKEEIDELLRKNEILLEEPWKTN